MNLQSLADVAATNFELGRSGFFDINNYVLVGNELVVRLSLNDKPQMGQYGKWEILAHYTYATFAKIVINRPDRSFETGSLLQLWRENGVFFFSKAKTFGDYYADWLTALGHVCTFQWTGVDRGVIKWFTNELWKKYKNLYVLPVASVQPVPSVYPVTTAPPFASVQPVTTAPPKMELPKKKDTKPIKKKVVTVDASDSENDETFSDDPDYEYSKPKGPAPRPHLLLKRRKRTQKSNDANKHQEAQIPAVVVQSEESFVKSPVFMTSPVYECYYGQLNPEDFVILQSFE